MVFSLYLYFSDGYWIDYNNSYIKALSPVGRGLGVGFHKTIGTDWPLKTAGHSASRLGGKAIGRKNGPRLRINQPPGGWRRSSMEAG